MLPAAQPTCFLIADISGYAAPKTKREMPLMNVIGPAYARALEAQAPDLIAQLDAELAAREADGSPEAQLRTPKPGGPLSEHQPPVIVG
ncbi:MAG: hypothetical protein E6J50_01125 [Chloroflexi bacterium]|nr:MAG: hypothetical protein E6J50_01125 [Chloroflexota bacterium]